MKVRSARAAPGNAEVMVVEPANDNHRLATLGENVACLVREFAGHRQNGDVSAVSSGSAAVSAECDSLELAVGRNGLSQVVVGAKVINAREEEIDEKSKAANRHQQDGAENEKHSLLGWL